jgi:hypothetical protein
VPGTSGTAPCGSFIHFSGDRKEEHLCHYCARAADKEDKSKFPHCL